MLSVIACGSSTSTSTSVTSPSTTPRCQANASSPATPFGSGGGVGSITVTVARDCTWNATTQSSWIVLTSAVSGQGDGTVTYRVSENADPLVRNGAIAVADAQVAVSQEAAACRYDVTPNTDAVAPDGGELTIAVHAHPACAWTAASQVEWASVSPGSTIWSMWPEGGHMVAIIS